MRQKIVGIYGVGPMQAQLVIREGHGGEFWTVPEKGSIARIKVGVEGKNWAEAVGILMHEILEFAFMHAGLRYTPSPDYSRDNGAYFFSMTHTQFSEASTRAAEFMADCLPDMGRAYNKWHKKSESGSPGAPARSRRKLKVR